MDEVDECAFLFGGKHGANAHHFALGAARVYEDLLGAHYRLKRYGRLFGVGCFFGDLLHEVCELSGGDDRYDVIAALNFALVGTLKGGANGDDPTGAQHL